MYVLCEVCEVRVKCEVCEVDVQQTTMHVQAESCCLPTYLPPRLVALPFRMDRVRRRCAGTSTLHRRIIPCTMYLVHPPAAASFPYLGTYS